MLTLADYATEWIKHRNIKPRTKIEYTALLERHINTGMNDSLGRMAIRDLNPTIAEILAGIDAPDAAGRCPPECLYGSLKIARTCSARASRWHAARWNGRQPNDAHRQALRQRAGSIARHRRRSHDAAGHDPTGPRVPYDPRSTRRPHRLRG